MITGKVENFEQFEALHPRFPAAFSFARDLIANGFKPGRNDMATPNNEIYASGNIYDTRTMDKAVMEVHYHYIDIQIIVEGQEQLYVPGGGPHREHDLVPSRLMDLVDLSAGQCGIQFSDKAGQA